MGLGFLKRDGFGSQSGLAGPLGNGLDQFWLGLDGLGLVRSGGFGPVSGSANLVWNLGLSLDGLMGLI